MKRILAIVAVSLMLAGCAPEPEPTAWEIEQATLEKRTPFEKAVEACNVDDEPAAAIGDGGNTLSLDMRGDDDYAGLHYESVMCVLKWLKVPDSTKEHMASTRALDGRQSDEWDGIAASWSYHPDDGMDVILTTE